MRAGAAQCIKQLSGAVRPRPQLRPNPRGARLIGPPGRNGGRSGDPFPFILALSPPGLRVRVPATPVPALWLQKVWRGGLEAAGMLIPVGEARPWRKESVTAERREGRTQPPGVAVGIWGGVPGAVPETQPPGGQELAGGDFGARTDLKPTRLRWARLLGENSQLSGFP